MGYGNVSCLIDLVYCTCGIGKLAACLIGFAACVCNGNVCCLFDGVCCPCVIGKSFAHLIGFAARRL